MGNFYTNLSVRSRDRAAALALLRRLKRRALVSPVIDEQFVVYDEVCDQQDTDELERLGAALSRELGCAVFGVLDHDDDYIWFQVHDEGRLVDEYNSAPGNFTGDGIPPTGGDAALLCRIFGRPGREAELEKVLRVDDGDTYVFAHERHRAILKSLGLPPASLCAGFEYVTGGDAPEGVELGELERIEPGS